MRAACSDLASPKSPVSEPFDDDDVRSPEAPAEDVKIDMTGWLPVSSIPEKPQFVRNKVKPDAVAVSADALGGEDERLRKLGERPLNDTQARLAMERTRKPPDFTFKTYVKPAPVFLDKPTHVSADKAQVAIPDQPVGPQHGPLFSPEAEAERCGGLHASAWSESVYRTAPKLSPRLRLYFTVSVT